MEWAKGGKTLHEIAITSHLDQEEHNPQSSVTPTCRDRRNRVSSLSRRA